MCDPSSSNDDEFIAKKNEARNWPWAVQIRECLKEIRRIHNGTRERIPESDWQAILSLHYEGEPEKSTARPLRDAMGDLIHHYRAVEIVSQPPRHRGRFKPHESIAVDPTELQSIIQMRQGFEEEFNAVLNDLLTLQKPDGRVFEKIKAHVSPKGILIMDVQLPIEVGDKLIRTLPNGLRDEFIVDDPGYREALGGIPAHFVVQAHRAAPIDSLKPSDFWRSRRSDFEELSSRQRAVLGTDRDHPKWLRGFCSRLDDNKLAYCDVDGGLDSAFRSKFAEVTTQAAIALGSPPDADPVKFWLLCLCSDLLQNSSAGATRELLQSVPGGGFIVDLLGSSAAYCSRLAAKADLKAPDANFRPDPSPDSDSPLPELETTHQATSGEPYRVGSKPKSGIAEGGMELLVKLPPEARARVRSKEAKANEQYSLLRRAFESDAAKAIAEWGGYVDLFKDNLNDALETAHAGIDQMGLLCAQFVFVAHAIEYRRLVSNPGELEAVLAKLREAIVQQYGEHTRASVQCKEAEEIKKALTDGNVHSGEAGSSGTVGAEAPVQGAKKRGRRSNPERREAIRKAIEKHGGPWRDHLGEIFTELDRQQMPLGDFQGIKIDLGDGQSRKVSSWDDLDLAQDEEHRQILDALRKYLP